MANIWPFDDPPDTAVITTKRITRKGYPVLYVVHDDEWQFLDGFDCTEADASVVGLQSMVNRDAALAQLADLPMGWYAERANANVAWVRAKMLTDE